MAPLQGEPTHRLVELDVDGGVFRERATQANERAVPVQQIAVRIVGALGPVEP